MKMTPKERKEINLLLKQMLKLCDEIDKTLSNMEVHSRRDDPYTQDEALVTREHYA